MINNKTAIGIIPARKGSKGLPGKNIRQICGKPLIGWTIEKALKSEFLDVVLVTTDSDDIALVARDYGATIPFMRPAKLASDTASSYDVIRHALDYYQANEHREFDYTVLLEPTSPLREDDDIDRVLLALDSNSTDFDAVVTLGEVGEHPSIMKRLEGNRIEPFCLELAQTMRRQDNVPAFFPYGVAYAAKTLALLKENTFYVQRCMGIPIRRYQNYEIDDIYDFICVENVMRHQWGVI